MLNTRTVPSKTEILGNLDPEKKARANDLYDRFSSTNKHEELVFEDKDLVLSGVPDFIGKKNRDGSTNLKRVWLPNRHLLIEEVVEPINLDLRYGYVNGPNEQDRTVKLFKTINEEVKIIGVFEDRLPIDIISHLRQTITKN